MPTQAFSGPLQQAGPIVQPSALVSTAEEVMWAAADFSRIPANDAVPGKLYILRAGGIMSWASTGTLVLTPRMGLVIGSPTLGVSVVALTTPGVTTAHAWMLELRCMIRVIGAAGANSTAIATGMFLSSGIGTLGTGTVQSMGGTAATFDASIATGITITKTLSVAGSITVQYVSLEAIG